MKNLFSTASLNRRLKKRKYRKTVAKKKSSESRISLNFNGNRLYIWGLRIFLGVILLGVVVFLFFLIRAYFILDFPGKSSWDGNSDLNILVVGFDEKEGGYKFADSLMIVRVSPNTKELGILGVDPDISFTNEGNSLTLRRAYNSGDGGSFDLLEKGINQSLAIKIDKYVAINEKEFLSIEKLFSKVEISYPEDKVESEFEEINGDFLAKKGSNSYKDVDLLAALSVDEFGEDKQLDTQVNVLHSFIGDFSSVRFVLKLMQNPKVLNQIETNFSKRELFDLYMFLRGGSKLTTTASYTKQNSLIIKDAEKYEKQVLWERVSQDIQVVFLDEKIIQEQVRVEILNATDLAGLAGRYKRNFENVGLRVVREGNALKQAPTTVLYVDGYGDKEHTIDFIKSVFGDKIQIEEGSYKYKHIGDMVLILGGDVTD